LSTSEPDLLVDSSVAVALGLADHELHGRVAAALRGLTLGLAGHAAFETYSVLTRLPAPHRRSPGVIAELLQRNFPATRHLGVAAARRLLDELPGSGTSGGKVFDALVAACAAEHDVPLATIDERATETYRAFAVRVVPV
jgi:predicted nucleic acid-binding protein